MANSLITTDELANYLKVTRQSIYMWRKRGMPYKKIGRAVRFDMDEVLEWLEQESEQAKNV